MINGPLHRWTADRIADFDDGGSFPHELVSDFTRCYGPSASSSTSNPYSANQQNSVQGASGSASPTTTVSAGGNVAYNDPAYVQSALNVAGSSILAALQNNAGLQSQVFQNSAQVQSGQADQLTNLENQISTLASYQGTNGGLQQSQNNKYIIYGAVGLGALGLILLISRRS